MRRRRRRGRLPRLICMRRRPSTPWLTYKDAEREAALANLHAAKEEEREAALAANHAEKKAQREAALADLQAKKATRALADLSYYREK